MKQWHCWVLGAALGAGALYTYQKSTGKMVPR